MKTLIILFVMAGVASAQPSNAPVPPPPDVAMLRKTCVDAMNADPNFAQSVAATFDKRIDQHIIDAHVQADAQVKENERHVIYAYAVMWLLAALFVGFLWYRLQMLKAELASLRRDLDASAKDNK